MIDTRNGLGRRKTGAIALPWDSFAFTPVRSSHHTCLPGQAAACSSQAALIAECGFVSTVE
jgi:hypothetical protein